MLSPMHVPLALLVATIWAGPGFAQTGPAPEPGHATFSIFTGGIPTGFERVRIEQAATGWTISSTGRLSPPLDVVNHRFEMRYDTNWRPLELRIDATVKGQPYSLHTTFNGNSATSRIRQAGQTSTRTDSVSAETLVLPNNLFGAYWALIARLSAAEAGAALPVYVAPLGEITARLNGFSDDEIQTPAELIKARRYRVTFLNPGLALEIEIWADANHRLLRVRIPAVSLDVARQDIVSTVSRLLSVSHAGDEEIRVSASGFSLATTITKPVGPAPAAGGRWPAVLLVPGSGSVDRDEHVFGIPIFGEIAGALADAGFLVARYDKRGIGQSGGRTESATLADYAEDVRTMVRYLEKRRDVDKKRIVVAGHSEGGWVALLAASKEKKIAGLALVATPSTLGADLILEQQRLALDRMQISEAERRAKIELQQKIHEAVSSGDGWGDIPADLRRQADTPWFRSFLTFDPADVMRKVRQPVIIVQGALDRQVPPHHADRLGELARARKREVSVEVVRLDGINHLLVAATTGEVDEYAELAGKTVSSDLLSVLTDWLSKTLPAPTGN